MNPQKPNRREFLGKATLGIAATTVGVPLLEQAVSAPPPGAGAGEMPYRTLGRSGEKVSLVGLGGYHPQKGISCSLWTSKPPGVMV